MSDITSNLVAASVISPKHIFGISNNWRNHVHFINDHKVLYPAGHNIIVYNIDEKQQSYIAGVEGYRGFTTVAVSPLRKFVAFGEKGEKPAFFVYDTVRLTKKKQFIFQDPDFNEVTNIAFLPGQENKFLVCTTGVPDNQLHCIQWSSNKITSSAKLGMDSNVTEVVFNKKDPKFLTCMGPNFFKLFQFNEGQLSLVRSNITGLISDSTRVFTTHTWLNDGRGIVCTNKGEIILISPEIEFITFLNDSSTHNWHIESIIPYSKGFMVGGDSLTVHLFEATNDETTFYVKGPTLSSKEVVDAKESRITSLSIVDSLENKVLCSTQNNCLFTVSLNSTALLSEEYSFEPLMDPFHCGAINNMDICIRKPLIVTCSSDRTVKIWDYHSLTLEYNRSFLEEAFAVSIHPSGFHVLVAFSDRIKMINIGAHNHWYEETTQNKEYARIKGCRVLQFSPGGQFFAAVNGSAQNNQQIQIFSSYTGESLGYPPLRGHFGRIKSLVWTKDDKYLVSCGHDGMTYIWRVSDGTRLYEFNSRGPAMSSVAILDDNRTVLGVGADKTIKKMTDNYIENIDTHNMFSQLALTHSNKLLFGGAAEENLGTGYIRCYKFPVLNTHVTEQQAHDEQGIAALKCTHDDHYLVSAGRDGVLAIFEIKDKEARSIKLRDGFAHQAEELLIQKKDYDEMKSHYEALKTKINEKKNETLPPAILEKEDLIKQLKEKQKALLENEQMKYANLENTLKETEQKYFDYIESKKKEYEKETSDLEGHYHEITIKKVTNIEKQKQEQEGSRERYRREIAGMIKDHNNKIRNLEDEYAHMIEDEVTQKNYVIEDRERIKREHEEMVKQIEEEIDKEIENLNEKNDNEVKNIMDKGLKSKGDVSIAKRKYEQLRREETEYLEREKEYMISKEELEAERQELKEILEKQKTIINNKDDIISEKEKRIYELKKRTQELEKFKAVLDFKIKELKKDIGPREEEIVRMKAKTNDMDMDLKKLSTINNTLGLVVDELDQKQNELQNHIKSQRNTLGKQTSRLKEIKDDVYRTVQYILDYNELKANVVMMKEKYADTVTKTVDIDQDILAEYLAQKKYLEKSVDMLKQNLTKDQMIHKQDNFRIMKDNVQLIRQINLLRQEIKNIQMGTKGDGKESKTPGPSPKTWKDSLMKPTGLSDETATLLAEKKKLIENQKYQLKQLKEKYHNTSTLNNETVV